MINLFHRTPYTVQTALSENGLHDKTPNSDGSLPSSSCSKADNPLDAVRSAFKNSLGLFILQTASKSAYSNLTAFDSSGQVFQKIRPEHMVPLSLKPLLNHFIETPLSEARDHFSLTYPINIAGINLTGALAGPVIEESLFRGFAQEVVLKKIPEAVFSRFFPDKKHLLDHKLVRFCRVTAVALVYALSHTNRWEEKKMGTMGPFIGGMISGALIESKGLSSISTTIGSHVIINALVTSIMQLQKKISYG